MKSGAGDDPFAEESGSTDSDDATAEGATDDRDATAEPDERPQERATTGRSTSDRSARPGRSDRSGGTSRRELDELPYIARRNVRGESVKKGRDKNILFELRPEIAGREDEFIDELEHRLNTDVPKTDAREAALAAIWDRPELVVPVLEEWGLGYFEE